MRHFWFLLLIALPGFGQGLQVETMVNYDTVLACRKKYLFQTITKNVSKNNKKITDTGLYVVALNGKKDTLLAYENLSDAVLEGKLEKVNGEDPPEDSGTGIVFELISTNIVTISTTEYQQYECAAHGESRYENAFYDLESKKFFEFGDIFTDSVMSVIAFQLNRAWTGRPEYEPVEVDTYKVKRYNFNSKNLILEFHYLDAETPIHVSYAEQEKTLEIPYKTVAAYMKKNSPIYRMVNGFDCWRPK